MRSEAPPRESGAFCMCFGRRSAGCFVMSSTSPTNRSRAATKSACSSTARRAASTSLAALARIAGRLESRRLRLPDPAQSSSRRRGRHRALHEKGRRGEAGHRPRPRLEGRRSTRGCRACCIRRTARFAPIRRTAAASTISPTACGAAPTCAAERLLTRSTDVFLFESAYIAGPFDALVGDQTPSATDCRQRHRAPPNSLLPSPIRTPPNFSTSANCAPPRASTRCSRRSPAPDRNWARSRAPCSSGRGPTRRF